jgi:hypothetical protein
VEEDPEIPLTLGQPSFTTTTIEDSKFLTDKVGKCSPNETVCAISGIANDTTVTTPVPSLDVSEPEEGGTSSKHTGDSTPTLCIRNKRCSFAKRKHWCEAIPIDNGESYDLWPSCNPNLITCDGGGKIRIPGKMQLWTSMYDSERAKFPWDGTVSFNDWIRVVHGNVNDVVKINVWNEIHDSDVSRSEIPGKNSQSPLGSPKSHESTTTERNHWCEIIEIANTRWASCDPFDEHCDGGSSILRVSDDDHLWTSTNDDLRTELPFLNGVDFDD